MSRNVLVVDVGGTPVKWCVSSESCRRRFRSGPELTPQAMVDRVRALVTEHVIVPLELGSLPATQGKTMAERVGCRVLNENGTDSWIRDVHDIVAVLREAFIADYVVLGGGNAKLIQPLPDRTRLGGNAEAIRVGFRLWEEMVEPHDREPHQVWRVVR